MNNLDYASDDDYIVGFRKPSNKTSPELRAAFALNANDLRTLRLLCQQINDDDFLQTITVLVVGIGHLLDEANKSRNKSHPYHVSFSDSSISSEITKEFDSRTSLSITSKRFCCQLLHNFH